MNRYFPYLLSVLLIGCVSLSAQKNKKDGIDFTRDIQPILNTLDSEQRSKVLDWAEEGAPIPVIGEHGSVSQKSDFFQSKVAPLLAQQCLECHDSTSREGALDLSRKEAAFLGGDSGEAIIPGDAEMSNLWESVYFDDMPEDRPPLSQEEKDILKDWINDGADWTVDWIDPAVYEKEPTGENWIRRLTVNEYVETVYRATGVDIEKKAREFLPPDKRADGFSNTAYNLNVDLGHVQAYASLAGTIVERMDVLEFANRFYKNLKFTDADMGNLLESMGKWLLRGPLEKSEIVGFRGISTTVASAGGTKEEAVALMLEAMLQSPRFIYRVEKQSGDGSVLPVREFELASRLSYTIWGGPPDEELLKVADKGELKYPFVLQEQVDRMLKDDRAITHSSQFIYEWLNLGRLDNLRPNKDKFPRWDPALAKDMRAETLTFFEEIVWKQNRPLGDLMNAQLTFATPELAEHYGLITADATIVENGMSKYELQDNAHRGGLLTQGSVLTVGGDEASMVTRGLFVLHDLLRGTVKPPPPGLDTTPVPASPGQSNRMVSMMRINDNSCGGCHERFEPLAFAFEKFDGVGAFHNEDEHGNELREDGELIVPGAREPVSYQTVSQLADLLAESDRVSKTLTWKVAQWALGRPLTLEDAPILDSIHETAKKEGGSYSSVISSLVMSELVQTTRTEPSETTLN